MRGGGPDVHATIRKLWILIAIIAALILALVIYQAYLRKEKKPSVPDNQRVQEWGIVPCDHAPSSQGDLLRVPVAKAGALVSSVVPRCRFPLSFIFMVV